MTWVNLDDRFPEHPKNDSLSDGAFRLQVAAICYCNRVQTDGIILADKVSRLVPRFRKAHVAELVGKLMWYELDGGRAYEVHDYLQWNKSREEIEEATTLLSKKRSEAGKKGAAARWGANGR